MTAITLPWYSDAEINDLCEGLTSNASKVKHLESMGLTVCRKPNGRPLLMRAHAELILSGMPSDPGSAHAAARQPVQPNRSGLVLQFGARRG